MRKSTFAAAICVIIAVGILAVVLVNPQQMREFFDDFNAWIRSIFRGGGEGPSNQNDDAPVVVEFVYKPFNAMPYIDQDELSEADDILSQLSTIIDYFSRIADMADGCAKLTNPSSPTIRVVATKLIAFYPNNREFQAKEIYYWVSNWISYDYEAGGGFLSSTQRELPVQTIHDRTGVCINYAVVLASLYEAAGFETKILVVWDKGDWPWEKEDLHALILLYMPNHPEFYQPFNDGWITLDATAGGSFGREYYVNYDYHDIADV